MSTVHGTPVHGGRRSAPETAWLARPRLLRMLDGAHRALVLAPQGAGKTTLLSQAAARAEGEVVRVRFEPGGRSTHPGSLLDLVPETPGTGGRALLVVDDAHHAIGTPLEDELASVLARASPQVAIFVGSRRPLPLSLARAELAAPVTVTDAALRFRSWEVERLYRTLYGVPLEPDDVSALTWHTDGWAAALELFRRSVEDDLPGELRQAIRRLDRRQRFAWDYLAAQVLRPLPVDLQRFLHATAALDLLTPNRCDALLGVTDSRATLARVAAATSLVRPVREDGQRVHRVLRRHLLAAVSDELSVAQARELHQRAAEVLEEEGSLREALRSRCRAQDLDGVRRLLPRTDLGAHDDGERQWDAMFSPELAGADAAVQLCRVRELMADGRTVEADRTLRAAESRADSDHARCAVLRGMIDALRGTARIPPLTGPARPPGLGWYHLVVAASARDPLSVLPETAVLTRGRPLAEGLTRILAGDRAGARAVLRAATNDVDTDPTVMLLAQLVTATLVERTGTDGTGADGTGADGTGADDEVEDALDEVLDRIHSEAERRGLVWLSRITHGVVMAFDDDVRARGQVARTVAHCERDGDLWSALLVSGSEVIARSRRGVADPEGWEDLARRCRVLGAGTLEAWARARLAVSAVEVGLPDAEGLAEQAEGLARSAEVPGALALAYVALAGCKPAQRAELLSLASSTARSVGLPDPAAPPQRAPSAQGSAPPVEPAADDAEVTHPTVVHRQGRVVTVRCFGAYTIAVDGALVDLSRLRPRARRTLRFLSMHAGRPVHRERIAEALWGELDRGPALHNLHVNVSAVRRALEPAGAPRGEGLVRRDGESYMLPLPPGSDCDVARFEQRIARARRIERDEPAAAAAAWQEALDAYGGDLLPEEGTAEWVVPLRDRYMLQAAGAAELLAVGVMHEGHLDRAVAAARRSIELNRWADVPWRVLVESLTAMGDHAAAEHARREHGAVLRELGVPGGPGGQGPVTTAPGTRPPPPRRTSPDSTGTSRRW
ncbi:BTAD domain-containing putative transcriptional regulator [Cellulosimicrobium arenosum]|uniref:Winged helix-turn-helix domain-containing protein n=1 Tax=Cellulosimicrobium arenosum TaxID=2708133 RepID=A0A927J1Y6_9MICO|nr:BTAD domain-containing putative transcriptional regulator [Cellulosimicrobium arenosum]MBD8080352.1 winged helix-turn-helix domain-containing protein [Cellulosimicrobium arenosum]